MLAAATVAEGSMVYVVAALKRKAGDGDRTL
jgi:hypothetical protein